MLKAEKIERLLCLVTRHGAVLVQILDKTHSERMATSIGWAVPADRPIVVVAVAPTTLEAKETTKSHGYHQSKSKRTKRRRRTQSTFSARAVSALTLNWSIKLNKTCFARIRR